MKRRILKNNKPAKNKFAKLVEEINRLMAFKLYPAVFDFSVEMNKENIKT